MLPPDNALGIPVITRLILQDFRTYAALDLAASRKLVALVGENGAGKTNLIEALSLFAAGRGLRRADLAEMARTGAERFAVSLTLDLPAGEHRLGVGLEPGDGGRAVRRCRIDGADASSTASFAELSGSSG